MDINLLNPYVRRAMHSVIESGISRRSILDYELIYVESGVLHLIYDETEYFFEPGSLLLLRPGVPHSFIVERENPVSQPHIHFDMEYDRYSKEVYVCYKNADTYSEKDKRMLRQNAFEEGRHSPLITVNKKEEFLGVFYKLIDTYGENVLLTKSLCISLMQYIIEDNFKLYVENTREKVLVAKELKEYIDANCERALSLDILENQFHYSKFYLEKEFKAKYNCSIMKYYNDKRLLKAKEFLKELSVTETAQALNFSSIYSFSRAYKNKFGISPSST